MASHLTSFFPTSKVDLFNLRKIEWGGNNRNNNSCFSSQPRWRSICFDYMDFGAQHNNKKIYLFMKIINLSGEHHALIVN